MNRSNKHAFTLIELLAVIGMMAVIMGVLSFSFRGGGQSIALQNAQAMCSSMVSAARAKAALTGRDARLVLVNDATSETGYLRRLAVLHQDQSGNWLQSGQSITLPKGVCVVPPDSVPVVDEVSWGTAEQSAFSGSNASVQVLFDGTLVDCWYISFTSRGTVSGSGIQIVLSTVRFDVAGFAFDNPSNMRGLKVSSYGVQTLISDADGFPTG
jgi:prepilin-type N-terminal cleavage/methylation domain-containing protein